MKKLLVFIFLLIGAAAFSHAGVPVAEAPIKGYGAPGSVSISTTTPTMVPTTQTVGRTGIYVSVPSANTQDVVGFLGNCTSTALDGTIRPIKISKSSVQPVYFPLREDVCLWLVSLHTGAETIHYQEVKQ